LAQGADAHPLGLVELDQHVASGICNPTTGERMIGSIETGVEYTGSRPITGTTSLSEAIVLASRSEIRRGDWERCAGEPFTTISRGFVAYKLALVAPGRADVTWILVPKHE
jgi:fructose-1,6-bisphosphatase/inositol monophosphatase family enzyme